jgi:glycosyltransferase involved in cell wall biosynthesis
MRILFVHQNFPAQFGHIARHLIRSRGWHCDFISETPAGDSNGIRKIQYKISGGARETTHYFSRTFENAVWHAHAVFQAAESVPELAPDLIVGHSGFGSTVFLNERFPGIPIINYFEYFYHAHQSDLDFRPDFPPDPRDSLRAKARNAMILLDLQNCQAGYSPTNWQRQLFPAEYLPKIDVIFDGIDTEVFRKRTVIPRRIAGRDIPESTRIVTYVSRGFESMRGFDIFMQAARRISQEYPDVLFVVVGSDRICYGGDHKHIRHDTFREHVLALDDYDLSKFLFTGVVPVTSLVDILSLSDLHIYLTVPFVLSWSLMNALACGCTILASNTAPVAEMISEGENGLLVDFFDVDGLARRAVEVLRDPLAFRALGDRGTSLIHERYALSVTLPRLVNLFERTVSER